MNEKTVLIPTDWLEPGAIVPVTPDTVQRLVATVHICLDRIEDLENRLEEAARACERVGEPIPEDPNSALGEYYREDIANECAAAVRALLEESK